MSDLRSTTPSSQEPFEYNFLEKLKFPVCVISTKGELVYRNTYFSELIVSGEPMASLDLTHPFFPEYRKRLALAYQKAMTGNHARCFAVMKNPREEQIPVEIYLFPMNDDTEVTSVIVFFKQVDGRGLSFDRGMIPSVENQDYVGDTNLLEFAPFPILRMNRDGGIIAASNSFEGFCEYLRAEVMCDKTLFWNMLSVYDSEKLRKAIHDVCESNTCFFPSSGYKNQLKIRTNPKIKCCYISAFAKQTFSCG